MAEVTITANGPVAFEGHAPSRPKLDVGFDPQTAVVFFGTLALALFFIAYSVYVDVTESDRLDFGGRGPVLGVTADVFADDDRIKSALVH